MCCILILLLVADVLMLKDAILGDLLFLAAEGCYIGATCWFAAALDAVVLGCMIWIVAASCYVLEDLMLLLISIIAAGFGVQCIYSSLGSGFWAAAVGLLSYLLALGIAEIK